MTVTAVAVVVDGYFDVAVDVAVVTDRGVSVLQSWLLVSPATGDEVPGSAGI